MGIEFKTDSESAEAKLQSIQNGKMVPPQVEGKEVDPEAIAEAIRLSLLKEKAEHTYGGRSARHSSRIIR